MAAQEEQFGAEPDAAAKQFVRKFDADAAAAHAQFRQLLTQKTPAGKLLQFVNRLDRQDIVLALTEAALFDARTDALVIVERARALVSTGAMSLAEQLLEKMSVMRHADYPFNYNAGRVMADARLYPQALSYYEAAFHAKPTAQAAERVFLAHLAVEHYAEAAAAIGRIIRIGSYRAELAEDFAFVLRKIEPGKLDPELAFALASLPEKDEEEVAPALLPHLIASDLLDSVLTAVDRAAAEFSGWDDAALAILVPYLERRSQIDHLLRVYEQSPGVASAVRENFARVFAGVPMKRITALSIPDPGMLSDDEDARTYREAAQEFSRTGDVQAALAMVRAIPKLIGADRAAEFYAREKRKLGRLAGLVAEKLGAQDGVPQALVQFVSHWAKSRYGSSFVGNDSEEFAAAIGNAVRMEKAPDGTKAAHLREDYFRFNLERRFVKLESLTNDFELCNTAVGYFAFAADQRPAVETPIGHELAVRLGQTALSLGGGKPLDVLTSFTLMQERPKFSLAQSPDYDEFCWWYVSKLVAGRKLPPGCQRPEILGYLNEVLASDGASGAPITRFLKMAWSKSAERRKAFDLGNSIDRILFVLELLQSDLRKNSQYLPLFEPFLSGQGILGGVIGTLSAPPTLIDAACGVSRSYTATMTDAPQDILLVGHASKESGLGRNFGMLYKGLVATGAAVTGIDFDAHASTVNEQIVHWRENCRTPPIAVFAVNANDVPDFFLKDRRGILLDTHNCGFFLWEVSTPPTVQKLGVDLVDEVWAPTQYVADIYAPLKRSHVVGKGLFQGDEEFLRRERPAKPGFPFTFVTVFDFDSSIERKNPLAVVMAFQDGFRVDDDVRLIVKTSNVNPQHWSNAWKQWEHLLGASAGDKRVQIVNQRYTGDQMTALVRDADCVVSLHRSEGFGYLISDAMTFGTPVIATDYSGNADFATAGTSHTVGYKLIPVPAGAARWHCEGAMWADADVADAARQMRSVFDNYGEAQARARLARTSIAEKYSVSAFASRLSSRIASIRALSS